jgi:hypothetical protein
MLWNRPPTIEDEGSINRDCKNSSYILPIGPTM